MERKPSYRDTWLPGFRESTQTSPEPALVDSPTQGSEAPPGASRGPSGSSGNPVLTHFLVEDGVDRAYEPQELVPLPAVCRSCRHEFTGDERIHAPDLTCCACFYCGGLLVPHRDYPNVISAHAKRKGIGPKAGQMTLFGR